MMMDDVGFGPWQFIVAIFWVIAIAVPLVKILHRTGHSGWWCIIAFIPLLNLLALWLFAFTRWPACDGFPDPDRRMA